MVDLAEHARSSACRVLPSPVDSDFQHQIAQGMPLSPNSQSARTVQEISTSLSPSEVLNEAKGFFARQSGVYSAFPEQESETHVTLRGQGGEEIVVAASQSAEGTNVTASSYLFDQQVARWLSTLPPPLVRTAS